MTEPETSKRLRGHPDIRLWTNAEDPRIPDGAEISEGRLAEFCVEKADGLLILGCGSYERALKVAGWVESPSLRVRLGKWIAGDQ